MLYTDGLFGSEKSFSVSIKENLEGLEIIDIIHSQIKVNQTIIFPNILAIAHHLHNTNHLCFKGVQGFWFDPG